MDVDYFGDMSPTTSTTDLGATRGRVGCRVTDQSVPSLLWSVYPFDSGSLHEFYTGHPSRLYSGTSGRRSGPRQDETRGRPDHPEEGGNFRIAGPNLSPPRAVPTTVSDRGNTRSRTTEYPHVPCNYSSLSGLRSGREVRSF